MCRLAPAWRGRLEWARDLDTAIIMGKTTSRVHVKPEAIRHLKALIGQLPGNAKVTVEYGNGETASGIVCVRPTVQSFRDELGREGVNSLLRLEDASAPGGERHIWLDQIHSVKPLVAYASYGAPGKSPTSRHPGQFSIGLYRSLNL